MVLAANRVLHVRCLGAFAIRGAGEWLPGPTFKRGREFIQYLISYPRASVSRDALANIFWPDLDSDVATHRLHLAVAGARAALREVLPDVDKIDTARERTLGMRLFGSSLMRRLCKPRAAATRSRRCRLR